MTPPEPFPSLREFLQAETVAADLASVLFRAADAAAAIAGELRLASLAGVLGSTGKTNVQGETVRKMDVRSNEILVEMLRGSGEVSVLASEEMEDALSLPGKGRFGVLFDPLDGSTNIDTGGCVGTIFSVREVDAGAGTPAKALLRPGSDQMAAGYFNYGPSMVLALTLGRGTHLFTYHPGREEFLLTRRGIRTPETGKVYATNEGQRAFWHPSTRRFVEHLQTTSPAESGPYATRYSGCLVTDVHRILLEGGIYFYPSDTKAPDKSHGKLRLLYECAPLAMLVEQAGGKASTGAGPISGVQPTELHQRVPLYIGSAEVVELAEAFETGRK